jgi:osmotically-inducible protein OsmY
MADNNRNDRNQSYGSQDWDQNNRRFENDDTRENYSSYGNSSYQGKYGQTSGRYGNSGFDDNSDYRSGSNRNVNYMPDNDDNRNQYGSGGSQYGSGGNQYSSGGYNQRSEGYGDNWNQQNRQIGSSRNYGPSYGWGYGQQSSKTRIGRIATMADIHLIIKTGMMTGIRSNRGSSMNQGSNWGSSYGTSGNRNREYDEYGGRYRNSGMSGGYQGSGSNYGRYDDRENRNRGERDWWDRTKDEVSSWFGDDSAERRREMDRRRSGEHKGKGPRGYQRSTDRIKEDVCDRLAEDDYVDASEIDIKVEDNEVILTGTVNSREEKRRAEDLVESISGVKNVENRIKVSSPDVGRTETTNTIIRKTGNMNTGKTDI